MTVRLDHTIVPAKDKIASAEFFAEVFGLTVKSGQGYFAQVQVNESLTFDFGDEPEPWGGHHYAFHVSEAEFDAIFGRVRRSEEHTSELQSHSDLVCRLLLEKKKRKKKADKSAEKE